MALVIVVNSRAAAQSYAFGAGAFAVPQGPTAMVVADFNGDGRLDIAVTAGTGVSILLGRPDGSFAPHVDYSVGQFTPAALAVGDFNGDGKLDIVTVVGGLQILFGRGDGTFSLSTFPLSIGASGIAVGDFNKDGKLDIAIAGGQSAAVAVLLGNGDGTLGKETDYATFGSFSVITGDFNGDGNIDLAVGSGYVGGGGDSVSILLGKGDGTFHSYLPVAVPGNGNDSLAAADLNRDGRLDLVVGSGSYPGGISVLLGNGDGSFAPAVFYVVPNSYSMNSVAVADFNRDKRLDIVATDYTDNVLWVWLGNGDGTFKNPIDYPASITAVGVVTGDFNGDGRQDIASVAGYMLSAAVTVLIGKGDGTFTNHVNHAIPPYPYDMAAGDFNGDGKPDLVVDSFNNPGSVSILLGNGKGRFTAHTDTNVGNYPSELTTGDFNGDGKLDVVVTASDPKSGAEVLSTLLGNGNGTLQAPLNQTISSIPAGPFAVADFDLDGKLDLATGLQLTTGVSVFFGNGDGTFGLPIFFDAGDTTGNPGPIFAGDLNGDHKPDLVVTTDSGVSILLSNGNRLFQPYTSVLPGYGAVGIGDFNGDGKLDLVIYEGSLYGVAFGNGDGTFQAPKSVYFPESVVQPLANRLTSDFNGDGKLDFAVVGSTVLSVFLGDGDGTFGQRIDIPTEGSPWAFAVADFNRDGGLDIAVANATSNSSGTVSIYTNRPVASLFPSPLKFNSQQIGTSSAPLDMKLYNSGGAPLVISGVTVTGDYSESNSCGSNVAVGASCTVSVTFKPTKAGKRKGTLSIKDNATVKPQTVILSGVGVK